MGTNRAVKGKQDHSLALIFRTMEQFPYSPVDYEVYYAKQKTYKFSKGIYRV